MTASHGSKVLRASKLFTSRPIRPRSVLESRPGDRLLAINGLPVHRAVDAYQAFVGGRGLWSQAQYQLDAPGPPV